MNSLTELLLLLARHGDVISMVIDAIESGKVPRDKLVKSIDDLLTDASDREMKEELG